MRERALCLSSSESQIIDAVITLISDPYTCHSQCHSVFITIRGSFCVTKCLNMQRIKYTHTHTHTRTHTHTLTHLFSVKFPTSNSPHHNRPIVIGPCYLTRLNKPDYPKKSSSAMKAALPGVSMRVSLRATHSRLK